MNTKLYFSLRMQVRLFGLVTCSHPILPCAEAKEIVSAASNPPSAHNTHDKPDPKGAEERG